jgi:long-subunit acyl-CoA synthetase (AMP-forming)
MSRLLDALAGRPGTSAAVTGAGVSLTGAGLVARAGVLARQLADEPGPVAVALPNGPDWIVADLALVMARRPAVPVPDWFGPEQLAHVAATAGLRAWLGQRPPPLPHEIVASPMPGVVLAHLPAQPAALPATVAKITFTSGTTGRPKGVCLAQEHLEAVAASIAAVGRSAGVVRHLCALPLAVLLENVAGAWAALLAGAECLVPPLDSLGMSGADGIDAAQFAAAVAAHEPDSLILVPALLDALVGAIEAGAPRPRGLRLVAVGGARVSVGLLDRAARAGLPVYEGYGLSECGSVVTLNRPGDRAPGTAGRPLPHARVALAPDGEVLVDGELMLGYAGDALPPPRPWPSGDIGRFDDDGRLTILGRKRNVFITAMGRNLSPEWIESELLAEPALRQAAVFGEGLQRPVAVLVAANRTGARAALARANARLPGHARIRSWILADEPFTAANGLATANGRVRRDCVWSRYETRFAGPQAPLHHEETIREFL